MKVKDASQRIERDVIPLAREVSRALEKSNDNNGGREELFDQELGVNGRNYGYNSADMMESLIGNSEDMLRESMSLAMETEQIGNATLEQMARQREQLQGANLNIIRTREIAGQ